jgi:hypothetical protein
MSAINMARRAYEVKAVPVKASAYAGLAGLIPLYLKS